MSKKFKAFVERSKPKKRQRRHKKNLNKSEKRMQKNIEDKVDNGNNRRTKYYDIT